MGFYPKDGNGFVFFVFLVPEVILRQHCSFEFYE